MFPRIQEKHLFLGNVVLLGAHLGGSGAVLMGVDTITPVAISALQSAAYFALCGRYDSTLGSSNILGFGIVVMAGAFSSLGSSVFMTRWLCGQLQLTVNKALWAAANSLTAMRFLRECHSYGKQLLAVINPAPIAIPPPIRVTPQMRPAVSIMQSATSG